MRKGLSPMPPRSRCSCFSKCVCSALQKFAGAVCEMDWKNTQLALFFSQSARRSREFKTVLCSRNKALCKRHGCPPLIWSGSQLQRYASRVSSSHSAKAVYMKEVDTTQKKILIKNMRAEMKLEKKKMCAFKHICSHELKGRRICARIVCHIPTCRHYFQAPRKGNHKCNGNSSTVQRPNVLLHLFF